MAIDISAQTRRVVYTGSAGTGPYAFAFNILVNTDVAVYFNNTELTLTTDYTVAISGDGTGSVTIVVGTNVPTTPDANDRITLIGDRTIERTTDFTTGGPLFATTLNDEFDSLTIFTQQNLEQSNRSLRAPNTDPTTINMELPLNTLRANKTLAFDASGNPTIGELIGDWRGNWAAGVAYNKRDLVKDTSNSNVYICQVAHTSSGSLPISGNADSAKWDLVVDAAAAGAAQAAAEAAQAAAEVAQTAAELAETKPQKLMLKPQKLTQHLVQVPLQHRHLMLLQAQAMPQVQPQQQALLQRMQPPVLQRLHHLHPLLHHQHPLLRHKQAMLVPQQQQRQLKLV
jgi:hypothetical protein